MSLSRAVGFHLAGTDFMNQAFILLGTTSFGFEFKCVHHGLPPFPV
jgi:hypothetical protein